MGEEDASAYGVSKERTMAGTPTWAVAAVCFVILFVSIFIEQLLHLVGHWLKKKDKPALYEALEKIKAELMLLGFISLILVVVQDPISSICVSKGIGDTWLPCALKMSQKKYGYKDDKCTQKGKIAFMSSYAIHQLHIFIFVLALFHVLYCITTLALGRLKMKSWKAWEDETKTIEYQYSHDPERFRFARDTSFGRRHLNFWSRSTILLWIVCFFRQFFRSVTKVDYLTLRHGFIAAHLAPGSDTRFDFRKYISRSLEEDFKVVVSISPIFWVFAVFYLLANTNGWRSYLWLPFIPLVIILLVSTKLQVIISKMGLAVIDRGDVVKGTPIVQPGDDLFWFNRPRLMLFLINFVLFQNAFQLAFFAWSWYTFGLQSCFHEKLADVIIRISLGIIIHVICSYVTLPLYAVVTQMGSTMRPTIFNDKVASALKSWHKTAKKHTKHGGKSESTTPLTSRPTTPTRGMSPVHLLHNIRQSDGYETSPTHSQTDFEDHWDGAERSASPSRHEERLNRSSDDEEVQLPPHPRAIMTQHEIDMSEFSFGYGKGQTNR